MSKKILRLKIPMGNQDVSVCLTRKAFAKEMLKLGASESNTTMGKHGCCMAFEKAGEDDRYVIGLDADIEKYTTLGIKALLVHELSHLVTYHMEFFGFRCDEYRATLTQQLYIDIIPFLDNFIDPYTVTEHESTEWKISGDHAFDIEN